MKDADASPLAEVLHEADALRQAVVDRDLAEARHRARMIETLAAIYDLDAVRSAAHRLEVDLGSRSSEQQLKSALETLSLALDQALE